MNTDAAAVTAAVEALVAAGADVRAESDLGEFQPLHYAADNHNAQASAAAVQALLAAGADALAEDDEGETPICKSFFRGTSVTAEILLAAMPTNAALEELINYGTPVTRQLFPGFIASRLPLTAVQWMFIPIGPLPGLGRALPAALASSADQARQVVRRLPAADAQRLRTAALCLSRLQRRMPLSRRRRHPLWPEYLPPGAVQRILSFCGCA